MTRFRRLAILVLTPAVAFLTALVPAVTAGAAGTSTPALPQTSSARAAAQWLAGQLTPQGFVPNAPGSGVASLSFTANTVLALSAANVDLSGARTALSYLQGNVNAYVTKDGTDGPGQLALLILDAESLGADPTAFGGTNLVARLLATQQTTGADAGLFGTAAQVTDFDAGNYEQGLALQALAAAGVTDTAPVSAASTWLLGQQCSDGGWSFTDQSTDGCVVDPVDFEGPDTNSTSADVQGLVAVGALPAAKAASALAFYTGGQDADGGWSYYPSTVAVPGTTDPDSTALVIQALIALGQSPSGAAFTRGTATPVSALLSFQLASGSDAGALYYPPAPAPGDVTATYQAVAALAGLAFPFGPSGRSYLQVASDGGIFTFGGAGFFGSQGGKPLNKPIVGIASTPDGKGYWEVASDGGIFTFGDAGFFGSQGGKPLNEPIVGIASTPDGLGYWEVASDGGIFTFGDAGFFGSQGGKPLNKPIVGIASTPDAKGYWEVASDGGIFTFGDATFFGSQGGKPLNKPIVGIASTPDGKGYWEVASDGGIFTFGDATFLGSQGGKPLNKPIAGIASTPDGLGYWEVASDGGIFTFGDATFSGSEGATHLNAPIVGIAASPARPA
jgi:hypothetical protein